MSRRLHKNQTEQLITYLLTGEAITFLDAFHLFRIQDLRKRLCEVRESGYRLKYSTEYNNRYGARIRLCRIDTPLQPGDWVRIKAAPTLAPSGTHPLYNKQGCILEHKNHSFLVADEQGHAFGWFWHKDLCKIGNFRQGQSVRLKEGPYTVVGRTAEGDTATGEPVYYLLKRGDRNFFAAPDLIQGLIQGSHAAASLR